MLKQGTLVRVDSELLRSIENGLTVRMLNEIPKPYRRRRSTVNDAGEGGEESTSDYTGMLHLSVVMETVDETVKYYLDIDWPDSGSSDETVVGMFKNQQIHWYQQAGLPSADALVVFDPADASVFLVLAGETFVTNWKVIGKYTWQTKTVSQLWRSDYSSADPLYSGYDGAFTIRYDRNAETVQILNGVDGNTINSAGTVSVNNVNHSVPSYTGGLTESQMFYYVRHRVAQSASSGDIDPDLTEEEIEELQETISDCDSEISTATQAISGYQSQISGLVTQRTAAYNAISSANAVYDNGVVAENARHQSVLNALDPDAPVYAQKVASENALHSSNLSSLASTRRTAVVAQQTIISGLDSQISTLRGSIRTQQSAINMATQEKNAACLELYGIVPASAGCEIVAFPGSQYATQTDQYLYVYLGTVQRANVSVSGISTDRITVTQDYRGTMMAFYRINTTCQGLT